MVISGARMHSGPAPVPNGLPTEKKAEIWPRVDLYVTKYSTEEPAKSA